MNHIAPLIMPKFKQPNKQSSIFKADGVKTSEGSSQHLKPHFSFENMLRGTGYSVECCTAEDRQALASKLFELSQISWSDIASSGRHGLGTEKIDRKSLKTKLPHNVTDDVNILAIRYNGKAPMLGYRDNRIFQILLIDWNFSAYDHG